ncbi:hypothetical protein [Sneathiella glossodoripedis]|uniref:hypothetical protein n=1 Tax=Sneathiella glossodoripedis TaxID=418853 RepID=UPI00047025B2|nr:hypothetical protein [Sneathiella glossodoripedis]
MKDPVFNWHIDPEVGCLFTQYFGILDRETAKKNMITARQSPDYKNHFNILTDIRGCDFNLDTEDLKQLAKFMESNWPTNGPIRTAMLVNSDLAHGLTRMYAVYFSDEAIAPRIFHDNSPNLAKKLIAQLALPKNYQFPDFLNLNE